MPKPDESRTLARSSRRNFLKTSATAAVAGSLAIGRSAAAVKIDRGAHVGGDDTLKVGLIGCGGRGTGAASNALGADKNTKLVAMADAFGDRLQGSLASLKKRAPGQVAVNKDHCFVGFDAYKRLLASGVDVVILATPPQFRPVQLKACVDAGKHIFCEKPVAVDAPGVRSVLVTSEEAKKKNLAIVSGLCWRYHYGVRETMKRVLDGAIGRLVALQETYNAGTLWQRPRQPGWTEMQYQMRNWLYFTWLSGDHIVEQFIHSLDKSAWAMRDEPPARAWGLGGRQVRTDPKFGNIYDHHAVVYEYPGGVRTFAYCRQQSGCANDVGDIFLGTKGHANILKHRIEGENQWQYRGRNKSMYDIEHQELFASIRSGKPINNGLYMARSTMLAILGRMCTYTGAAITWDQALNSKEDLSPSNLSMDATPPIVKAPDGNYPVPMPGATKFV